MPGASSTAWPRSASGSACSFADFSRPASSSAAPCPTRPRWARAARSRRAATGARPPTATPAPGSPTWRGCLLENLEQRRVALARQALAAFPEELAVAAAAVAVEQAVHEAEQTGGEDGVVQ